MIDLEKLAKFLVKAKKATYANEEAVDLSNSERPLHKELEYGDKEFYYRDSYTGFFQAPGMEEVRLHNEGPTIWAMAYSGGMMPKYQSDIKFAKEIFGFLKRALSLVTEDMPFRGPRVYSRDNLVYKNIFEGDIKRFRGYERILLSGNNEEVFNQDYIGGLVIRK
ncbi:MAG: DUF5680 domain-containing protein [Nanoarchaeota archaeon]